MRKVCMRKNATIIYIQYLFHISIFLYKFCLNSCVHMCMCILFIFVIFDW